MFKQVLCGVALLSAASFANAGFVTQEFTIPLQTTNLQKSFTYDLFDDNNGTRTLESVEISLSTIASGISFVENQDQGGATIVANLSADISLLDSLGEIIVGTQPFQSTTKVLEGFDGVLDFAGPSGTQFPDLDATISASRMFTDPANLLTYISAGTSTSTIDFKAVALSYITGNGNITSGFNTLAGGDFSIVYKYSEVPVTVSAPVGFAFIGTGLFVLVMLRKRIL